MKEEIIKLNDWFELSESERLSKIKNNNVSIKLREPFTAGKTKHLMLVYTGDSDLFTVEVEDNVFYAGINRLFIDCYSDNGKYKTLEDVILKGKLSTKKVKAVLWFSLPTPNRVCDMRARKIFILLPPRYQTPDTTGFTVTFIEWPSNGGPDVFKPDYSDLKFDLEVNPSWLKSQNCAKLLKRYSRGGKYTTLEDVVLYGYSYEDDVIRRAPSDG